MAELLRIGYGKEAVSVYRTDGVSSLFAAEIGMTLRGESFVPSYTEGDNTLVVATDSMKNFIQITALEYDDVSLEGFLELLAAASWTRTARSSGSSSRPARCRSHGAREQSFQSIGGDHAVAELALDRDGTLEHRSGRTGLRLMKLTGSSFEGFVRDEYTTLADSRDRPLFIHLDVHWRNRDFAARADGEAVRDSVAATFAELRLRLHPGARARDGPAAPRRLPGARRGLLRRREPALGHGPGLRSRTSACACTPTRARRTAASS